MLNDRKMSEWKTTRSEGKEESGAGSKRPLSHLVAWATIVSAVVAVAVAANDFLSSESEDGAPSSSVSPRLRPAGLNVINSDASQKPTLDVLLHNEGGQRSIISGAKFEVLGVDALPYCFTQGDLPVSGRYGAQLSTDSKEGDAVEVQLHQQLAADAADRFQVSLSLEGEAKGSLYLFELGVSVLHDGKQDPTPVGRALVSLPQVPFGSVYYLAEDTIGYLRQYTRTYIEYDDGPTGELWAEPLACWLKNAKAIRAGLAGPAERSPEMAAVGPEIITASLAELPG